MDAAWELVIQTPELLHSHRRTDAIPAPRLAERALILDPNYATAWTMLGWSSWNDAFNGWSETPDESLARALEAMERAVLDRQLDRLRAAGIPE